MIARPAWLSYTRPMESFFWWSLFVALYMAPPLIAVLRDHHNVGAILMLDLLLGWTGLGWIIAMIWAFTAVRPPATAAAPPDASP